MSEITVLDENGLGIAGIEFSNDSETLTSDSTGKVEFESGKTFTRNTNIGPVTEVAEVRLNFLPSEIKK